MSTAALREYKLVLSDPIIRSHYPQLSEDGVAIALERIRYVGDSYGNVRTRFVFPRDPKDAHLIELAIAGSATHLLSTDSDLLALPTGRDDAAHRFRQRLPTIEVLRPYDFCNRYARVLSG